MQTMIANTELDKKEKKIGKLQEIVKEADNRLVELKENMETKDFLEKKQRVLSVENQKLRKDFRKLEALLEEKENTVDMLNKQLKDFSTKYKKLEEFKSIEIEILKNDLTQKDIAIDQYENTNQKLNALNHELVKANESLETEVDMLERLLRDAQNSLKEMSMKNLKNYKGPTHPILHVCETQIKEIRQLVGSKKKNPPSELATCHTASRLEQEVSLVESLDAFRKEQHADLKHKIDSLKLQNNIEVLVEALESMSEENRQLSERLEMLLRSQKEPDSLQKASKDLHKNSEQVRESAGRVVRAFLLFADEFENDYGFLERETTRTGRDILTSWKTFLESIKKSFEESEFRKPADSTYLQSDCKNQSITKDRVFSSYKNSHQSKVSLLDDSFDQENMFRETELKFDKSPESAPHPNQLVDAQMDPIEEESGNMNETFEFKPVDHRCEENFTFDISPEKHSANDLKDLQQNLHPPASLDLHSPIQEELVLSGFCTQNESQQDLDRDRPAPLDRMQAVDESTPQQPASKPQPQTLYSVTKSMHLNEPANIFERIQIMQNLTTKKDATIRLLKKIIRDLLREMNKLTTICLEFDTEHFTENDLVEFDIRVNIPINDDELHSLPGKISTNLDRLKWKQMKCYLSGAKRVLDKFVSEELLEAASQKDKKLLFTYMKDLGSFDPKNWMSFEACLKKADHIADYVEQRSHKMSESLDKLSCASSYRNSVQVSEKQVNQMESIIKEIFRLTTPMLAGYYDEEQLDLEKTVLELKLALTSICSADPKPTKHSLRLSQNLKTPPAEPTDVLKQEMQAFLKALKRVHLSLSCDFSVDHGKVTARLKKARHVLKELLQISNGYYKQETDMLESLLTEKSLKSPLKLCQLGEAHPVGALISQVVIKEMSLINIRCRILEEKFSFDLA